MNKTNRLRKNTPTPSLFLDVSPHHYQPSFTWKTAMNT